MTKAADVKHWQAKLLQHQQQQQQQLVQLQQQQQQLGLQSYVSSGAAAAAGGVGAGHGLAMATADSAGLSRQSSCIPALYGMHSGLVLQQLQQQQYRGPQVTGAAAAGLAASHSGKAHPFQQQQPEGGHQVYSQLTISAVDVEAPSLLDQQLLSLPHPPSPLCRPGSSSGPDSLIAAAAAAVAAAGAGAAGVYSTVPPLLLPAVTLLFVSVEGSKVLRKHLVRAAHCQLSLLFMESLRHVQGGYMCRMQVRGVGTGGGKRFDVSARAGCGPSTLCSSKFAVD